ncbi:unnamed protein product, partial [marine sediment metagenome]
MASPHAMNKRQQVASRGLLNIPQPTAQTITIARGNHTSDIAPVVLPEPPTPLKVSGNNLLATPSIIVKSPARIVGISQELKRKAAKRAAQPPK